LRHSRECNNRAVLGATMVASRQATRERLGRAGRASERRERVGEAEGELRRLPIDTGARGPISSNRWWALEWVAWRPSLG
jgi:hypothetical protein